MPAAQIPLRYPRQQGYGQWLSFLPQYRQTGACHCPLHPDFFPISWDGCSRKVKIVPSALLSPAFISKSLPPQTSNHLP